MISDETLMAYIDGAAPLGEVGAIEAELQADAVLRARLERLKDADRALRGAFGALLERPIPDRLLAMMRDARPELASRHRSNLPKAWIAALLDRSGRERRRAPDWMGLALAGQVGLLLLAAGLLRSPALGPAYHALGAEKVTPAGNLVVIFQPDTREQTFREALTSVGARMVDGPSAAGVYVLHVPADHRAAVLARLRGRADVVLAEPVDSGKAP